MARLRHAQPRRDGLSRVARRACIGLLALSAACGTGSPASETAAAGWPGVALAADRETVAAGRRIAEAECASCHAIDAASVSPNPSAPSLRDAVAAYDPDELAYRLIESMRIGHDDMPLFDFDLRSADALIAYLKSLAGQ